MGAPKPPPPHAPIPRGHAALARDVPSPLRDAERLRSLLHLATELGAVVDAEEIARRVLTELLPVVGGARCVLYQLTRPDTFELLVGIGFSPGALEHLCVMPLEAPFPAAAAARQRRPLWYPSYEELRAAYPNLYNVQTPPSEMQAVVALPLVSRDRLLGTMAVSFREARGFDEDEREFFRAVSDLCAQAIDRVGILEEQRRARVLAEAQSQHLANLQEITVALAGASTQREVAQVIVGKGRALLGADQAVVAVAVARGRLRVLDTDNMPAAVVEQFAELGTDCSTPLTVAYRTGQLFVAEHEHELATRAPDLFSCGCDAALTRAAIAVPIPGDEGPRGAIGFAFYRHRSLTDHERQFVLDLANLAALAMARARLFESEAAARETAEQALANAREAERRKDEFLAMLGHELRNPLAPIMTAVELMKLRGGVADEKIQDIVERQVRHMSRLVEDLLDISRITRGKIELHPQLVDLATVIGKAVEQVSALLEQKAQPLALEAAPGLEVIADPVRLAQVFANLLTNAAKYSPTGAAISIAARRVADTAVVTVRDEGIGIASELLPQIFEVFMQAPQAISRSQGGLGLGLALVKKLVQMHGGEVVARSEGPGRGSQFEVTLPLASNDAGATTSVPPPPLANRVRTAASVLVVDDNQDLARMLADSLAAAGHATRVAFDGPSALHAAQGATPEVVIIDIGLPVMDGYEVCRRLRELASPPRWLVALTGYGQPHDRQRALDAGFDAHLVKPVDTQTILTALDDLEASD